MIFFKKFLISIFVLTIYISIVSAAAFDIETIAIKERISIDEFASYQIKVTNNLNKPDQYRIYTSDFPTWDVRTDPIVNPITLELDPGEEGTVDVLIDPLKIRDIGSYAVNINVRSSVLNQLKAVPVEVTVLSTQGLIGGYVPTVVTSVGIPEKIDPREEVKIRIVLNNQNIIDYKKLEVRVDGDVIKKVLTTELGPKEEKILEFTLTLDKLTPPQLDKVIISLYSEGNSIISPIVRNIEIVEYADIVLVDKKKGLLMTRTNYELTSNTPNYKGSFRVDTTLLGSIFSSESPNAKPIKENGKRYLEWNVQLKNNKVEASVRKNFFPTVIVILVIIGLAVSYYAFRSPLQIRKESSNIKKKEGGVSEMSVILHIKNRGQAKIKNIDITETIPSIVSIERDVSIGSLQPNKVLRHERKGTTVVKWDVDELDPGEERVLSYKIKTKLSILGSFSLPVAAAAFKYNRKTFTATSNRLNVDG